jgi:putative ABC transport system ATP-binding protein
MSEGTRAEQAIVQLRDVTRVFPGYPDVHALRPFSLDIASGDFLTIVGPSGSGKSTFLNLLGLIDRPTAGRYYLRGLEVGALRETERSAIRGRQIGFVFQSLHLMESRTSFENAVLATAYQGLTVAQSEARVRESIAAVGLSARIDTVVGRLSGGERQRVAIARALVADPALLLCDEPTGNLDSQTSHEVLSVLHELNRRGSTIVLITHDPEVAARGSRQVSIRDGELTEGVT